MEVAVPIVKSRMGKTANGQFCARTYPGTFSFEHLVQVTPSKPVFNHERAATAYEKFRISMKHVRAGLSRVKEGEKSKNF
jgi:hypothetical protein